MTPLLVDGITVCHFDVKLLNLGIGTIFTYIIGEITEIRTDIGLVMYHRPIESGRVSVLCNTSSVRRRLLQTIKKQTMQLKSMESTLVTHVSSRRLQSSHPDVYGDASGDGSFTLADIIFVQEYYNQAPILGCASSGGDKCTNRSSLSTWQQRQISPVNESGSGARDIPYIIGVFLQRFHFIANSSFVSSGDTLKLQIRLLQKDGKPVTTSNTRVLFVLNSRILLPWTDALYAPSYDVSNAMISVYAGVCKTCAEDGWFAVTAKAVTIKSPIIAQRGSYFII